MPTLLNAHSHFSLLTGLPAPADLARAAAAHGYKALGLNDHQHLTGAIEFYEACRAEGVKPILGLQAELRLPAKQGGGRNQMVLLAMDMAGWASLCALSSHTLSDPGGKLLPIPFDLLVQTNAGLLALAGHWPPNGAKRRNPLGALKDIFGDRLYQQLPAGRARPNGPLASLAQSFDVPLTAQWPVYYLQPEDAATQRLLAAMRLNQTLDALLPDQAAAPPGAYFPSVEQLSAAFSEHPRALAATDEIAQRCNLQLPLDQAHFPELKLPDGRSPDEELRTRAYAGARERYAELTPDIEARLEHELTGIQASGYTSLFLMMEEIISFAREADVPTNSRGSASSSLVAHCLGITTPDPVRLNLYFERFLNPARKSPPDIDTDLCSRRRDVVIRHIYDHYGHERVAMVATINRFRRRSALREVAKAHGLQPEQIKEMADRLPYRYWGPGGDRPKDDDPYADLKGRYSSERHQRIFAGAAAVLGLPNHLSIHPGGVVIAPGPITNLAPTQYSSKGVIITQFDKRDVERLGLVKLDMLGIRGLTVLGDVADQIRRREPGRGRSRLDVLDSIPDEDEATAATVRNGNTIGCFQIESPGMRATLKEVQADNIDNITVALALFRPGPLQGGLKDAFVRRHLGQEPVSHLHLALEPLLADTHGVVLYQEQVLRIAHELGGLSLADADLLRRAMSHFDPGKQMITLKERFLKGAKERHDVPEAIGEQIWDLMAAFAGYGFPKAHAASYALAAWRSAWCKTHYPAEFLAAVMANWGGYYGQATYLMEARRMGLTVRPPHINYSQRQFSVSYIDEQARLFMGLDQLRDLTRETQSRIIRLRPFDSLADFLTRVDPRRKEARNLIETGALDGLGSIPNLLAELEQGSWRRGQMPLFEADVDPVADWPDSQKAAAQERLLGASLVEHPLEAYGVAIAAANPVSTIEAAGQVNRTVRVAGMRQTWRRTKTSSGSYLYFTDLGDFEGTLRVVISEEVYQRSRGELAGKIPVLIEGRVELGRDAVEPALHAQRITRVDHLSSPSS
jgi:DNA-directed DNA polymerase III PolC